MLTWCRLKVLCQKPLPQLTTKRPKVIESKDHLITQYKMKETSEKKLSRKFVDYKQTRVSGGNGGNGCLSFLSIFGNEFAGPDGGDGGNGGHVIFEADANLRSLGHVPSQETAEDGGSGRNKNRHGKNATHTYIKVPLGTLFKNSQQEMVADLQQEGDVFVAARGGAGGHGNKFFATALDTAPTTYEEGGRGESLTLMVELRVMAHVGLVGFPNAGKSTLLGAVSRARPKVAAYPFTTLNPHVGMVEYPDHEQVAVADLPGLIAGAHQNRGLGLSFLRHVERCVCLLYVLDLSASEPWTQLDQLRLELDHYQAGLSRRPHAVVANKVDLPGAADRLAALRRRLDPRLQVFPISAKHRVDLRPLVAHIRELFDKHRQHGLTPDNS